MTTPAFIRFILNETKEGNKDNISRSKCYQNFYMDNREIHWAFLASMVSRNAGWNMTDLNVYPMRGLLHEDVRKQLFLTFERANWLIFSDAYPQLLLYKKSKECGEPLFHYLSLLGVSRFMIHEWTHFWHNRDKVRLVKALIINEQNVIQKPIIQHPFFKKKVFHQVPYLSQDFFHLSAVLFPTTKGNLYGASVHDFTQLTKRISLGKKLYGLLFHPNFYPLFHQFAVQTEPIGSRMEYEQYFLMPMSKTPMLRTMYPIIEHKDNIRQDWYISGRSVKKKWWKEEHYKMGADVSHRFYAKKYALLAYQQLKHPQ
ncbi:MULTISPECIES: DUF2515 family protein [Pontibacillus]|uniref:DUF2515 family protein n=1 Tax=Pontibacillus chungwhensis TaxID=265426 RepID=A0ABY8V2L0_9BACI|nr:DUF2515 family protein [Pontibacillus chungwhensis]MCD5322954.1 DUF2515 domain-containing protein [Pontibacillus sp. HN14]WIG00192.1 DUF2515 family protein [Pontibacillus chungwhensis]